jgi:hypothetical protein
MVFKSELEVDTGDSTGKVTPKLVVGSAEIVTLLGIRLGNVSEGREAAGIKGTVEGKVDGTEEWEVKLRELVMPGSRGSGTSGKEAGKVDTSRFDGGKVEAGRFKGGKVEAGRFKGGKVELAKFKAPVGKEVLKLGYCMGCCMEGGIASPGGGRSKDWCKCGIPLGGP